MIVFVAGMSRAGSMWTYNVVRAIYETKEFLVLPETIPIDEIDLIKRALKSEVKENEVYCVKTHFPLKPSLATTHDVKIICNVRDIRDACLSFIRFMHADYETNFEAAINTMVGMMNITDHYLTGFGDSVLSVRFEDLTNNPQSVVENIGAFLKIDLSKDEKREILREFSKPNIQKKISDMKKIKLDTQGQVEGDEQKSKFESVRNFDGTYRVFEKTTSFQSNHITSTKDGEWRTHFGKNQIDRINSITKEWLLKHGYKV